MSENGSRKSCVSRSLSESMKGRKTGKVTQMSFQFSFCASFLACLSMFFLMLLSILLVFFLITYSTFLRTIDSQLMERVVEDMFLEIKRPLLYLSLAFDDFNGLSEEDWAFDVGNGFPLCEEFARKALVMWEGGDSLHTYEDGVGAQVWSGDVCFIGRCCNLETERGLAYFLNETKLRFTDVTVDSLDVGLRKGQFLDIDLPQQYILDTNTLFYYDHMVRLVESGKRSWADMKKGLASAHWSSFWKDEWFPDAYIALALPMYHNVDVNDTQPTAYAWVIKTMDGWRKKMENLAQSLSIDRYVRIDIYVVETSSKKVIAYTNPQNKDLSMGEYKETFIEPEQHPQPYVRRSFKKIGAHFSQEITGREYTSETIIHNGVPQVLLMRITDPHNFDVHVVTVVSQVGVLSILLSVCAVAFVIFSLFFALFAFAILSSLHLFLRPLKLLTQKMHSVSKMEMPQSVGRSFFSEIRRIQKSFGDMVNLLNLYKKFLPNNILQQPDEGNGSSGNVSQASNGSFCSSASSGTSGSEGSQGSDDSDPGSFSDFDCVSTTGLSRFQLGLRFIRVFFLKIILPPMPLAGGVFEGNPKLIDLILQYRGTIHRFEQYECSVIWLAQEIHRMFHLIIELSDLAKGMRFALVTKVSSVGNIGNDDIRFFSCSKDIVLLAEDALEVGLEMGCSNVVGENVFDCDESAKDLFENRLLNTEEPRFCELGVEKKVTPDEWMYEMAQKEKFARWNLFNSAVASYERGDHQNGLSMMKKYSAKNPTDEVSLRWLERMTLETENQRN